MSQQLRPYQLASSTFLWMILVTVAVLLTSPAAASAEDGVEIDDPEEECSTYLDAEDRHDVEALTFQGVACFQAEEYAWALTYYTAAYDLDADLFLLGGIGRSLHELGIFELAVGYYQRFLRGDDIPSGADRIHQRLDELDRAIDEEGATVSLRSSPSGVTAYVVLDNGHWYEIGPTPVEIKMRDGDYEFAFHAPGFRPRQLSKSIDTGESQEIRAEMVSEDAALNVSDRKRRIAGVWTMGAAIPATATGATLIALSMQNDDRGSLRTPGTVVSAAGATALLTGAIIYLSASSSDDPAPTDRPDQADARNALSVEPTVGINHLGLRLRF